MTRKDYIIIAKLMHTIKPKESGEELGAWRMIQAKMSDACMEDNERFDREKFRNACEHGT